MRVEALREREREAIHSEKSVLDEETGLLGAGVHEEELWRGGCLGGVEGAEDLHAIEVSAFRKCVVPEENGHFGVVENINGQDTLRR